MTNVVLYWILWPLKHAVGKIHRSKHINSETFCEYLDAFIVDSHSRECISRKYESKENSEQPNDDKNRGHAKFWKFLLDHHCF